MCALLLAGVLPVCAQSTSPSAQPAEQSSSSSSSSKDQQSTGDQPAAQPAKKQPSRLKRALERAKPNCIHVGATESCWDQNPGAKERVAKREQEAEAAQQQAPRNQAPPRSEAPATPAGESSSRDTRVDLSPPPDDMTHEGADTTGVTEFHAYDPHKAAHNVEVGNYELKRKNYRAAESRFAEALEWKPNDAIATFFLAHSQEKLGKKQDALNNYQAYLKILPSGEYAGDARSGIERLKK